MLLLLPPPRFLVDVFCAVFVAVFAVIFLSLPPAGRRFTGGVDNNGDTADADAGEGCGDDLSASSWYDAAAARDFEARSVAPLDDDNTDADDGAVLVGASNDADADVDADAGGGCGGDLLASSWNDATADVDFWADADGDGDNTDAAGGTPVTGASNNADADADDWADFEVALFDDADTDAADKAADEGPSFDDDTADADADVGADNIDAPTDDLINDLKKSLRFVKP